MDNGSQFALTLMRLSSGGYVVQDIYYGDGRMTGQHFACTTIDEALKFMRDAIYPIGPSAHVSSAGEPNG